jgi:hypothetical protein
MYMYGGLPASCFAERERDRGAGESVCEGARARERERQIERAAQVFLKWGRHISSISAVLLVSADIC